MRTSIKQIYQSYKNIYIDDNIDDNIEDNKPIKPVKIPKTEKEIIKIYYEKSKDKIAKHQKEYIQNRNIPVYRIKLILKMINDKDYINKTIKTILDKYNINK